MKYLLHFRPSQELSDLITLEDNLEIPPLGLHCTVALVYMRPEMEQRYVADLRKLHFKPFEVQTESFANFDDDSLVLRLSKPHELEVLHKEAMRVTRKYAEMPKQFEEYCKRYGFHKYAPHITIGSSSNGFNTHSPDAAMLLGISMKVCALYLSKKESDWHEVASFRSPGCAKNEP